LGHGRARRLDDEHVLLAHVLLDFDLQVLVREAVRVRAAERNPDVAADRTRELRVCRPRKDPKSRVHEPASIPAPSRAEAARSESSARPRPRTASPALGRARVLRTVPGSRTPIPFDGSACEPRLETAARALASGEARSPSAQVSSVLRSEVGFSEEVGSFGGAGRFGRSGMPESRRAPAYSP